MGGDFSVCFYCGLPLRFNPDLTIREATEDDLKEAGKKTRYKIRRLQKAVEDRNALSRLKLRSDPFPFN